MMGRPDVSRISLSSLLNNWVVPGAIYVALASGAGNPIRCHESSCDFSAAYLAITAALFFIAPFIQGCGRVVPQLIVLGFGLLIFGVIGYASPMPEFVYSKAWGGFLASGFVLFFMVHLLLQVGLRGLALGLARIMFLVLGATFLFKVAVGGVMDRDIPYLLNGPIVFGWLMGMGALCALYLFILERGLVNALGSICLSLGVLWSGSKGPILAYALSTIFLYIAVGGFTFAKLRLITVLGLTAVAAILLVDPADSLSESRFGLLVDIYENGINYSEGSVGVRLAAQESAVGLIQENPMTGIGPGGFAEHDPLLMYPHNVHLEVLLEYGLFIFTAYALFMMHGVARGNPLIRSIVLFFVISMSFSGDLSYLRYLLPFLLLSTLRLPQRSNVPKKLKN